MAFAALEDVTDAIEATTDFLLPVDTARWLRMAVIVFFVAGGGGVTSSFNTGTSASGSNGVTLPTGSVTLDTPSVQDVLVVAAAVVAVLLLVGLVVWAIGSVMEFVFVEALGADTVRVRRPFRDHLRRGLRLFGFRLGVGLLSLAVLAGFGALVAFGVLGGSPLSWNAAEALAFVAFLLPVFFFVVFLNGLVLGFTTVFVVPVMLLEDRGVLSAWGRFWPTLRANLGEYAVYAVLGFLLTLLVGLVSGTIVAVAAVLALIPFGVVGGIVFLAAGGAFTTPVVAVLAVLGLLFLVVALAIAALVAVPFQTFLRYYALFVLGDTNDEFDAIPDVRARVREGDETPPTAG
jgi:hypothetical protein